MGKCLKPLIWLILAVPAAGMVQRLSHGALAMDLLHPSGEMAVRLMILAMLPGPLADAFGRNRFLAGWTALRRSFGVAAFGYAMLHLVFYALDMGAWTPMFDELALPSIWTGWLALALMLPAAAISSDAAMRALGRTWKRLQRPVYAALLLGLLHWVLLEREWLSAAVHLSPLLVAWGLRLAARHRRRPPLERTMT